MKNCIRSIRSTTVAALFMLSGAALAADSTSIGPVVVTQDNLIKTDVPVGSTCGLHTAGVQYNSTVLCQGHDPRNSCPTGYQRAGGDYQSPGDRWYVTCVRVY